MRRSPIVPTPVAAAAIALASALGALHCSKGDASAEPGASHRDGADGGGDRSPSGPNAPRGDGKLTRGAGGCLPVAVQAGRDVGGYMSDVFTFHDARCAPREAALVRNDRPDPGGSRGGFLRRYTYEAAGGARACTGTGVNGWNGFGYVVNHHGDTAYLSDKTTGTHRARLTGKHHAIHEFTLRATPGGPVDVTLQWMFATGRSHPVFAITFDATPAGPNAVLADTRAPYGDIAWDGTPEGAVDGVGWGDRFVFRTTGTGPLTASSPWTYTQPNIVPHAVAWSNSADAEMGLVQTETFEQKVAGGDYGNGLLEGNCWERTSATATTCAKTGETLPADGLWPFQLNQYELPFTTTSHRVAWGSSYGAVGQTSVEAFGKTFRGYPFLSYSLFVVFGAHRESAVAAQVADVERTAATTVRATRGTLAARGPEGVGRSSDALRPVPGFDPIFFTWDIEAEGGGATLELTSGSGVLDHPIVRVLGYEGSDAPRVRVGGEELTADVDFFATLDAGTKTLWLTLNGTIQGTTAIEVN